MDHVSESPECEQSTAATSSGKKSSFLDNVFTKLYALYFEPWAHISRLQTPGLMRSSPPHFIYKRGCEPGVEPGVWRLEIWAQKSGHLDPGLPTDQAPNL
jgi:hypothetical protein